MSMIAEVYLQFPAFSGLFEVKGWPNYCLIWGFIKFTRNMLMIPFMLITHRRVNKQFNHIYIFYTWWMLVSNWKPSKHHLEPVFYPLRSLSENKFAEINNISDFKLLLSVHNRTGGISSRIFVVIKVSLIKFPTILSCCSAPNLSLWAWNFNFKIPSLIKA